MNASRKAQADANWADAAYEIFTHQAHRLSTLDLRIERPAHDLPDVQLEALCKLIVSHWRPSVKRQA